MRVGLFTESYDPIINGVSTSVKTLAAELAAAGHTPVIVAPRYPGFVDAEDGPRVLRLPSVKTIFAANRFVLPPAGRAPAALRGAAFDIVHTHHPFGMGFQGRRLARALGVPLVSTNHTLYNEYTHYFPLLPKSAAQALVSAAMRRYYNLCDTVVVPSQATAAVLKGLGITGNLCVVPTGVPEAPAVMPAAIEQTRRNFSLPKAASVLLFVGRLAREKNLDLLLEAFARVCAAFPDSGDAHPILLLAGSGPYRPTCRRRAAQLGVEPWVRFTGFLKRSQLAPVYAGATLFVFASPTETQGVVLSEAQSHGLPCVVVGGGGAPEFVRDGVDALVVPADVGRFADAALGLLNDPERRRAMSTAARESPLRPTPADMARQMIRLYESARAARKESVAR